MLGEPMEVAGRGALCLWARVRHEPAASVVPDEAETQNETDAGGTGFDCSEISQEHRAGLGFDSRRLH